MSLFDTARKYAASGPAVLLALVGMLPAANTSAQELTHLVTAPQDGTILGEISDVDLAPDGRILALDGQVQVVYRFSPDGWLDVEVGGKGQGPGEIMLSTELEVGPAGELMVADLRNQRLTLWAADGSLLRSRRYDDLMGTGSAWSHELIWGPAGLFLKMAGFASTLPIEVYTLPEDLIGSGRTVYSVPRGEGAPTCAFCPITLDASGGLLAVRGDTLYSIVALDSAGVITAEWARRDLPVVHRSQEEIERFGRTVGGSPGVVPGEVLDRFGPHRIGVDDNGRIWTAPRVRPGEPGFFDVFSSDGRLLRTIGLDVTIEGFRIRGDRMVISSATSTLEPVVRVYSIR